jgi:ribokinase
VEGVHHAIEAGRWLVGRGVKNAIVTLGAQGSVFVSSDRVAHFPAPQVPVVDTTGAGDIFSGALMVALCEGKVIDDCIALASHAAALAVTRLGVIASIPTRQEVDRFLDETTATCK